MTTMHRIPGIKHYRSIDQGINVLVKSDDLAKHMEYQAQVLASYMRQLEVSRYAKEKQSTYKVERATVEIGRKSSSRVGARITQEMRSWRPMHDRVAAAAIKGMTAR